LLEAMAEGTITVGEKTHTLPELFMVLATQNPIDLVITHQNIGLNIMQKN
jgi:MoxR-like ATPase